MDSSDENGDRVMEDEGLAVDEDIFENEDVYGDDEIESAKDGSGVDENEKKENSKKTVKRVVKNSRVILNFERLKGPNGYNSLVEIFEKFKFKGKHFEHEDLTAIMQNMQHWMCHHLYPGYDIETCMKALEKLGKKRVIQTDMRRMRQEAMSAGWENKENVSENNIGCTASLNKDEMGELLREPMED